MTGEHTRIPNTIGKYVHDVLFMAPALSSTISSRKARLVLEPRKQTCLVPGFTSGYAMIPLTRFLCSNAMTVN